MRKKPRSDLVTGSGRLVTPHKQNKFHFFERRSTTSEFRRNYQRSFLKSREFHIKETTLDYKAIEKVDQTEKSATKSIDRITNNRKLETPRSISNFVNFSKTDAEQMSAAQIIQKNWKIHIYKKKLNHFLAFVLNIRRRRLRYALSMWALATTPKFETAQRSHENVFQFLLNYNFFDLRSVELKLKYNLNIRFFNFDAYMKTNILFSKYPANKIMAINQSTNNELLRKYFVPWNSLASERAILDKSNQNFIFVKFRQNFGPEYWTYHVWRRWATYKRNRKWELVETISSNLYVPEWTFYRAKKLHESRLRNKAFTSYKIKLGKKIIQLFRDEIHKRMVLKQSYNQMKLFSNRIYLIFGYKAFSYLLIFKRVRQGILMRAMKAWYSYIDFAIMSRTKIHIFTERIKIRSIKNAFQKWKLNILTESAQIAYLHDNAIQNKLKILPFVFLIKNDQDHYTYCKAFKNWKYIITKKKRLKKYFYWSTRICKNNVRLRYFLDLFKNKAKIPINRTHYYPFNSPDLLSNRNNKYNEQNIVKILCPTSSISETILSFMNLEKFQIYKDDWAKTANSYQIKTFFFRLVCLIINKNSLRIKDLKAEKMRQVHQYLSKKQAFSHFQLNALRYQHTKYDCNQKEVIKSLLQRDSKILSAFDSHSTAIELSYHISKFTVNDEIHYNICTEDNAEDNKKGYSLQSTQNAYVTRSFIHQNPLQNSYDDILPHNNLGRSHDVFKDINMDKNTNESKDSKQKLGTSEVEEIETPRTNLNLGTERRGRRKKRFSAPSIPFLSPIKDIKNSLMSVTSKYRRRPDEAFAGFNITHINTRQTLDSIALNKGNDSANIGYIYEHHVPLHFSQSLINLFDKNEFKIKELAQLQKKARSEKEKNSKTENTNEEIEEEDMGLDKDDLNNKMNSDIMMTTQNQEQNLNKSIQFGNIQFSIKNLNQQLANFFSGKPSNNKENREEQEKRERRDDVDMPTTIEKDNKIENHTSVEIDHKIEINPKAEKDSKSVKEEKLENSQIKNLQLNSNDISTTIDHLERHFLNDSNYFSFSQPERISYITRNYDVILEMLLGKGTLLTLDSNTDQCSSNEDLEPHSNISQILIRINERSKKQNQKLNSESKHTSQNELLNALARIHLSGNHDGSLNSPMKKLSESSERFGYHKMKTPNIQKYSTKKSFFPSNTKKSSQSKIDNSISSNKDRHSSSRKENKRLFDDDADGDFEMCIHTDGNEYQKSYCPEFDGVLFSGDIKPNVSPLKKEKGKKNKKKFSQISSPYSHLPTPQNLIPGFEQEPNIQSLPMSLAIFSEKSPDIDKALKEIIHNPRIDLETKNRVLFLSDLVAQKFLDSEVTKTQRKDITSFVEVEKEEEPQKEAGGNDTTLNHPKQKELEPTVKKKYNAFPTKPRKKKYPNYINSKRQVFLNDLVLSILEAAKYMSIVNIQDYGDLKHERSALKSLKHYKNLYEKGRTSNLKPDACAISITDPTKTEVVFSPGGHQKWSPSHNFTPQNKETGQNHTNQAEDISTLQIFRFEQSSATTQSLNIPILNKRPMTQQTLLIPKRKNSRPMSSAKGNLSTQRNCLSGSSSPDININALKHDQNNQMKKNSNEEIGDDSIANDITLSKCVPNVNSNSKSLNSSIVIQSESENNSVLSDLNLSNDDKSLIISHLNESTPVNYQGSILPRSQRTNLTTKFKQNKSDKPFHLVTRSITLTKTLSRHPQYTKFERSVAKNHSDFEAEFDREMIKDKKCPTAPTSTRKPKWIIPNDKHDLTRKDIKYFVYVTPFVKQDEDDYSME